MAKKYPTAENLRKKGYTLLEILCVLCIVGILSSVAILNYSVYRNKAWDVVSQEDLRQAYSSAMLYFMDYPQGTLTLADLRKHGFVASPNVEIRIIHGRLSDLLLIAFYDAPDAQTLMSFRSQMLPPAVSEPLGEAIVPESGGNLTVPGFQQNTPSVSSALLKECNEETQRALKEAFVTARSYLEVNPEGWVTKDILLAYGFTPNENVNLTVVNGTSSELFISAIFNFPEATNFTIDPSGKISSVQ